MSVLSKPMSPLSLMINYTCLMKKKIGKVLEQLWDEKDNIREIEYINFNDNLCWLSKGLDMNARILMELLKFQYNVGQEDYERFAEEQTLPRIYEILDKVTALNDMMNPVDMCYCNYKKICNLFRGNDVQRYYFQGLYLFETNGKVYYSSGYLCDGPLNKPGGLEVLRTVGETLKNVEINGNTYLYNKEKNHYYEETRNLVTKAVGVLRVPLHLVGQ